MKPSKDTFRLFGINGSIRYAEKVAGHLGVSLTPLRQRRFSDGEVMAAPDPEELSANVRNCDCYFISDPYTDENMSVNDKLMQTFIFIHALRKASAKSVTWIKRPPAYDRQDRKTKPREPVTTQVMGMILDSLYLDRLITLDPHSLVATNNSLRRANVDVLQARKPLAEAILPFIDDPEKLVIQAPDEGAVNRHVKPFRRTLEQLIAEKLGLRRFRIPITYFDKEHSEEQETVTGDLIIGDVNGKDVLVIDDMIATGGTIDVNRQAIEINKGRLRYVVATHGYFTEKYDKKQDRHFGAYEHFDGVEHVFITDSMGCGVPWRLMPENRRPGMEYPGALEKLESLLFKLHVVDTSEFVARALWETDNGGSINSLLKD